MIIHSYVMPGQHLPGVFSSGAAAPLVAELLILASPSAPARRKPTTPTTSDCSRGDHRAGVMGRQPERRHLQDAVKRIARASDLGKTPSQHKPEYEGLRSVCDGADSGSLEGSSPCAYVLK